MSSETGIQDVRVSIKEIQMSSETGIQDVRFLIVRIAKINSFEAKRIDIRITRIWEIYLLLTKVWNLFFWKDNWQIATLSHKKIEKVIWNFNKIWECVAKNRTAKEREGGEKGGEQEQQREKGAKEQGRSLYTP